MKSMRISNTKHLIEITYKTIQKANKIYSNMDKWEKERCCLNGVNLTYDLSETKFEHIGLIVRDLFKKSCDVIETETNLIEYDGGVDEYFEAVIEDGKLFKITLIREDGVIGKYGFGCWQYGRILNINDWLDTFRIVVKNSNLEECTHKISFTRDIDLLIEIGEIKF